MRFHIQIWISRFSLELDVPHLDSPSHMLLTAAAEWRWPFLDQVYTLQFPLSTTYTLPDMGSKSQSPFIILFLISLSPSFTYITCPVPETIECEPLEVIHCAYSTSEGLKAHRSGPNLGHQD